MPRAAIPAMEGQRPSPPAPSAPAEVRARHPQMMLRIAEEHAPAGSPSVASALRVETRAALDASEPMTWLPVEVDVEVVEAVSARLGAGAVHAFEARQREEMKSSVFDGFVQRALRAFAPSPVNLVKRIPAGWGRLFRNAGWIAVVSTDRNVALLRFHKLPPPCIGSSAWMAALPVSMATFYDLVGVKGTVDCRIEDAAEGTALATFRWR